MPFLEMMLYNIITKNLFPSKLDFGQIVHPLIKATDFGSNIRPEC